MIPSTPRALPHAGAPRARTLLLVGVLAGLAGGVAANRLPMRGSLLPAPSQEAARQEDVRALGRELASLRADVVALTFAAGRRAGEDGSRAPRPGPAPSREAPTPPIMPAEAAARLRELTASLDARFAAERRDPTWAAEQTNALTRDLAEGQLGSALQSIECGATMCRLVLDRSRPELAEALDAHVAESPLFEGEAFYARDPEGGEGAPLTVYLAREGHSLPLGGP